MFVDGASPVVCGAGALAVDANLGCDFGYFSERCILGTTRFLLTEVLRVVDTDTGCIGLRIYGVSGAQL